MRVVLSGRFKLSRNLREEARTNLFSKHRYGLPEGATFADGIALAVAKDALEGKPAAVREIGEALEGKAGPRQAFRP